MSGRVIGGIIRVNAHFGGAGYLAGTDPYGLVSVASVPARRWVHLLERSSMTKVASVFANADGTWQFDGLDPAVEFDVIARDWSRTYNDVIIGFRRPEPYDVTTLTDHFTANSGAGTLDGYVEVIGGLPGHTVAVTSGAEPTGLTFAVSAIQDANGDATWGVTASGPTTPDTYNWDLTVTAPNGSSKTIALSATFT